MFLEGRRMGGRAAWKRLHEAEPWCCNLCRCWCGLRFARCHKSIRQTYDVKAESTRDFLAFRKRYDLKIRRELEGVSQSESGRGGWKTQGGGKHTVNSAKTPSPKTFLDPPTYDTFSPPLFWRLSVISLKRKRRRPDQPRFLRPPKVVLESTLCSTFPPPQVHAIRFAPPSAAAQARGGEKSFFFLKRLSSVLRRF